MTDRIVTARLTLIAATPELLSAELDSTDRLCALLDAEPCSDWPPSGGEYDRNAVRFFLKVLTEAGPCGVGWYSWYGITNPSENAPATLVASAGYFGPPDQEGTVEIGYSVSIPWRGKGIATELVAALVDNVRSTGAVKRLQARPNESNRASIAVLQRNGFRHVGTDGTTLLFELVV